MEDDTPLACSLSADDYSRRRAEIEEVGEQGYLGRLTHPDGVDLTFRNTPEILARLTSIVRAEQECCSFLKIDIEAREAELVLGISAPRAAAPIIQDLAESFGAAQNSDGC